MAVVSKFSYGGRFDKVYVCRVSRVDKSLVHEICRSFSSRSTVSLKKKKKKKKTIQPFSREAHSFRDFLIPLIHE